jgi:hypothetical protein
MLNMPDNMITKNLSTVYSKSRLADGERIGYSFQHSVPVTFLILKHLLGDVILNSDRFLRPASSDPIVFLAVWGGGWISKRM